MKTKKYRQYVNQSCEFEIVHFNSVPSLKKMTKMNTNRIKNIELLQSKVTSLSFLIFLS